MVPTPVEAVPTGMVACDTATYWPGISFASAGGRLSVAGSFRFLLARVAALRESSEWAIR